MACKMQRPSSRLRTAKTWSQKSKAESRCECRASSTDVEMKARLKEDSADKHALEKLMLELKERLDIGRAEVKVTTSWSEHARKATLCTKRFESLARNSITVRTRAPCTGSPCPTTPHNPNGLHHKPKMRDQFHTHLGKQMRTMLPGRHKVMQKRRGRKRGSTM